MRELIGLVALALSQPALADVIMPGPPLVPMQITQAQANQMLKAARKEVFRIFDFSRPNRAKYLDDAYRNSKGINDISKIVSARVVGDRVFMLVVATKNMGPLTIGETYSYLQFHFDDRRNVSAIDVEI